MPSFSASSIWFGGFAPFFPLFFCYFEEMLIGPFLIDKVQTFARDSALWSLSCTQRPDLLQGAFSSCTTETVAPCDKQFDFLQDGFMRQAVAQPDQVAITETSGTSWTYETLFLYKKKL